MNKRKGREKVGSHEKEHWKGHMILNLQKTQDVEGARDVMVYDVTERVVVLPLTTAAVVTAAPRYEKDLHKEKTNTQDMGRKCNQTMDETKTK